MSLDAAASPPFYNLGRRDVTTYLVTNQITPFFCFKSSQWIVTPSICKPGKRCDNTIKEISGRHRSRKSALGARRVPKRAPGKPRNRARTPARPPAACHLACEAATKSRAGAGVDVHGGCDTIPAVAAAAAATAAAVRRSTLLASVLVLVLVRSARDPSVIPSVPLCSMSSPLWSASAAAAWRRRRRRRSNSTSVCMNALYSTDSGHSPPRPLACSPGLLLPACPSPSHLRRRSRHNTPVPISLTLIHGHDS